MSKQAKPKAKSKKPIKDTVEKEKELNPLDISGSGLRLAWIKFIDAYIANGGNGKEAYMVAYPDSSEKAARFNASRLITNDNIRNEINNRLTNQKCTDEWIGERLMGLVDLHYSGKGAIVAVKALEILAKIKGLLVDTKRIAFTGENPALFTSKVSDENRKKFKEATAKGERITE